MFKSVLAATCVLALSAGFAEAAPKKAAGKKGKNATELVVINERKIELSGLVVADQSGNQVGKTASPVAPGKRATVKLSKGAGCVLNVATQFADEGESEGTTDACKDKTLRLKD